MISPHPSAAEMETSAQEYICPDCRQPIGAADDRVWLGSTRYHLRCFEDREAESDAVKTARSTAIAEGRKAMREEIVAWLRSENPIGYLGANICNDIATAIESGEPQQGGVE